MKKIFLIGGGEITKKETLRVDLDIIREGGGKKSRILFFPTAASDSDNYIRNFVDYFLSLGCGNILWAKLTQEPIKDINEKINWATAIYLGGGSTKNLINLFEKKGVVKPLKESLTRGVVLAGMSAGATAMGDVAIASEIEEDLEFSKGFEIIPEVICLAHYEPKYKDKLSQIKANFPQKTIFGIPEKSAVYYKKGEIEFYNKCFKL